MVVLLADCREAASKDPSLQEPTICECIPELCEEL